MLSYGQRPALDFMSAEDRLPLGFHVEVEDESLKEELGGVIDRLGGEDHTVSHRQSCHCHSDEQC